MLINVVVGFLVESARWKTKRKMNLEVGIVCWKNCKICYLLFEKKVYIARVDFKAFLKCQRKVKIGRKRAMMQKKLTRVEKNVISMSYLFQQYNSPRC